MKTFDFYGVCDNHYKLNDKVWLALEDPDDGYRSYLKSIEEVSDYTGIFFPEPLAKVVVISVSENNFSGYKLIDVEDNHVWLIIGTDDSDSYYPMFIFNYQPKAPVHNTFYEELTGQNSDP